MTPLSYLLPVAIAALGIVASAYECWNKRSHRPTRAGAIILLLLVLATLAQLLVAAEQDRQKIERSATLTIGLLDLHNSFSFYEARTKEVREGSFYFYGTEANSLTNLRNAPYLLAGQMTDRRKALIDGGLDAGMIDDMIGILHEQQKILQEDTTPQAEIARQVEYTFRTLRERLLKEALKGQMS